MRNSVRNLMCVGRYAEKMQWSEAKWSLFEPLARSNLFGQMPAIDMSELCIPAECDNIKYLYNGEIASHWDANLLCDISRHFASVMLHFASLISHNLRCIPAYTHQIPPGFFIVMIRFLIRAFVGFLGELGWGRCFFWWWVAVLCTLFCIFMPTND